MTGILLEKENIPVPEGEDDVRAYLQQIRQYPRLTPQQEKELARNCAAGDPEAIRTMVNSNLRLVVSIAREYAGRGVPLLDLVQEGSIGLLTAAKKFDPELDFRFSTYATKWIRQGINRYVLNYAGIIRVPRQTMERMRKLMAIRGKLQKSGHEPTVEEIAAQAQLSVEKVQVLLELLPQTYSLDAPAGEDTLQQFLEDAEAPQPQQELVRRELKETMDRLLAQLPDRQQQVLRLRFGMEDGTCHTLEYIGNQLNVSKERARQLEKQAIDRLHRLGSDLGLEDFLE